MPENQPHRAEVSKLLVAESARRQGIGTTLMRHAEELSRRAGKTLLVLDTATGSDAERLYLRLGWTRVGVIPNYSFLPNGVPCGTTIFLGRALDIRVTALALFVSRGPRRSQGQSWLFQTQDPGMSARECVQNGAPLRK